MKLAAMIKKMCPSDSELSVPAKNRYRMVVLGSSKVGKSAIVSRFLSGRFEDAYTPTIEDFHRKFYSIRGEVYQLDILDTSGNHPFPAMRRLSILTGELGSAPAAGEGTAPRGGLETTGPRAPARVRPGGADRTAGPAAAPQVCSGSALRSAHGCWCRGDGRPGAPKVMTNLSCPLGSRPHLLFCFVP